MSQKSNVKWENKDYLPLLNTRDGLTLAEILHYGDIYPTLLIYKSTKRQHQQKVRAKQFQQEIYQGFTKETYYDIVECFKPPSTLLHELDNWLQINHKENYDNNKDDDKGNDNGKDNGNDNHKKNHIYLELSIRLYCSLHHPDLFHIMTTKIEWSTVDLWYWRFYFAKLLILQ